MKRKSTDNLQQELMQTADLNRFLRENQENFSNINAAKTLEELFSKRQMSKSALAKRSGMSEVYLHQLFSGRRNPSRRRTICICIGMQASVEEAQLLLRACGYAPLYAREQWDAVVLYSLTHGLTLQETNDELFRHGLEPLTAGS